jgi:hypothetical protein
VLGLNRAFELAPEDRNLRFVVACQALLDDKPKFARTVLAPLAYDPHARGTSENLLAAIDLLDAGRKAEALQTLQGKAEADREGSLDPTPPEPPPAPPPPPSDPAERGGVAQ